MSGSSWLERLTHKVIFEGEAFGEEAMVNSRGFCRGQCSRNSTGAMALTPSMAQNSHILQHSCDPCNSFSASGSAISFPMHSRAAGSSIFGCSAINIFFVGARAKSQYLAKASPKVHGVGKGCLMAVPGGFSAVGCRVIHMPKCAGVKPMSFTAASTSAGSFSGSRLSVPPSLYSFKFPSASISTSTVARPCSGSGFCRSSRTFVTLALPASK
mmetsp:Transcript_69445/g.194756  ORF Transcript_69445/g.194756 Transcript_69445/m.194756 type:complete len:213 (+) Transcript_69445:997-1635(+)